MQANAHQAGRAHCDGAPVHYERHRPEQTTLYRMVQQHAATFFARAEETTGAVLPQFVKDEFDAFLECGILAHGADRGAFGGPRHPPCAGAPVGAVAADPAAVQGAMPRQTEFKQTLCADINGFSLHAAVRCAADDRDALEQLCRTITRPALANERVQTNAAGQVVLKLKTAWRDGTTHLVMSPLEFMQRLAALVPRPRLHLIRFHGVLAPNAKLRALVVPQEPGS